MRVIDCDCGTTLSAANDQDLLKALREHYEEQHAEAARGDDELEGLIADQAYDASDA